MSTENSVSLESFTVSRFSKEADQALETGYLNSKRVRVGQVILDAELRENIVFFRIDPQPASGFGEHVKRLFFASRAYSLTATLMPCLAVAAYGFGRGIDGSPLFGALALLGAVLLQVSVNLYNDFSDYRKLIDLPGTPGGSGVFHRGWYTPAQIRLAARISLVAAIALGVPIIASFPVPILICGGLGALGALFYSHERFGLKYHALGDLPVLLLCGPVLTAGFGLAAFGHTNVSHAMIGGFFGLLAWGLLHMNNLQDIDFDRGRGASTLAIRLGFRKSQNLLISIYAAAGVLLVLSTMGGLFPWSSLIALAFLVPSFRLFRLVRGALGPSSPQLDGARILAAQIHLMAGALLTLGLVLGRLGAIDGK